MVGKRSLRATAKLCLYIGLLVIGIGFALDGILEYAEGKTTFKIKTQPLVHSDLPAITICLEFAAPFSLFPQLKSVKLNYGKDVNIQAWDPALTDDPLPLSLGLNELGKERRFSHDLIVKEMTSSPEVGKYRHCYKISHQVKMRNSKLDGFVAKTFVVEFSGRENVTGLFS